VQELIRLHPPVDIKSFSIDKLIHCIDLITSIPANNKDLNIIKGWVPIHSDIIRKPIPNYKQYMNYLQAVGVIECNNSYTVGNSYTEGRSKGYRFTPRYFRSVVPVEITNATIIRHLKAKSYFSASMAESYKHLMKWFDDGLQIDMTLAMDFIQADRDRKIHDFSLRDKKGDGDRPTSPWQQYQSSLINIMRILNREFYMKVDTNVYRFHSNLTNMRSALRNCLSYRGRQLVSLDIRNSQPYLSVLLLNKRFWGHSENIIYKGLQISDMGHNTLKSRIGMDSIQSFFSSIMSQESVETLTGTDLQQYINHVIQGRLYNYLSAVIEDELGVTYNSLKEVKPVVFQVLFSPNTFLAQTEAAPKRLFKQLFPTVYELFRIIKATDYTVLARLLQKIESELVLRRITKRIAKERPHLPIFTIHDSIATTLGNEDYVKKIMEEVLFDAVGYLPILKMDYWQPGALEFSDGTSHTSGRTNRVA
jgi:hypothetical protein